MNSFIAETHDFQTLKEHIQNSYKPHSMVEFIKDDFLLDDAKAVVKEAFVAEQHTKIILLGAKNINIYAQNSLLKILEEPPRNIIFILAVHSKSALLPTIRSRLPVKVYKSEKKHTSTGLNLKNPNLKEIFDFLVEKKFASKEESKEIIESITKEAIKNGIKFSEEELSFFGKLLHLSALNTKASTLLTAQLLTILNKVYK